MQCNEAASKSLVLTLRRAVKGMSGMKLKPAPLVSPSVDSPKERAAKFNNRTEDKRDFIGSVLLVSPTIRHKVSAIFQQIRQKL